MPVFPGPPQVRTVGASGGHAIGADHRAVQVEVGVSGRRRAFQCGGQVGRVVGEHGQAALVQVAVGGRGRDAVVPGELDEPGAVDEPAQHQHGLLEDAQGAGVLAGAAPHIVVGALLDGGEGHRQHRLGPVQRLHLRLFVDRQDDSAPGRSRYSPTISATFSANAGPFDNLKVPDRPDSGGGLVLVSAITRPRVRGGTWSFPPPRFFSTRPAGPCPEYRVLGRSTVRADTPASSAMSLRRPSPAHNTVRARRATSAVTCRPAANIRNFAAFSEERFTHCPTSQSASGDTNWITRH